MLQRIQFIQLNVFTVLCQLWKGFRDTKIKDIAFCLGFNDAVPVELQAHAADEPVRLDSNQTYLLGPAQLSKWRQLVLRQVGCDDKRELREVFRLCI